MKSRGAAVWFALCVILFIVTCTNANELDELEQLASKSKDRTFEITSMAQYNKFAANKGKSYHLVVLLTVGEQLKAQCQFCPQFRKMYGLISALYHKQKAKFPKEKIYFAVIEYKEQTAVLVQQLGVRQVPTVMLFKAGQDKPVHADLQKQNVNDFIRDKTGVDIDINDISGIDASLLGEEPKAGSLPIPDAVLRFLGLGLFVVLLVVMGITVYSFSNSKTIAFIVLSYFVYLLCFGGLVYNMINEPPLFWPQQGRTVFFMPQHQAQLGLEGYMASFVMIMSALSLLAITEVIPQVSGSTQKRLYSYFFVGTFFLGVIVLVSFYLQKNSWYLVDTAAWPYIAILRALLGF